MKRIRRFLAVLLTLVLLAPAISLPESGAQEMPEEGGSQPEAGMPEDWEAAELGRNTGPEHVDERIRGNSEPL